MPLVFLIASIILMAAYGVLFLRPKFRIAAAAIISASVFFLYLALASVGTESVNRLSIIMLGVTGLGAVILGICHVIFERGSAGRMTGARRPPRPDDTPPRELTP